MGDPTPSGVQPLVGRARWEAEEVCKDCGADVVEHRGEPQAVLVLEEPGLLTPGPQAAGVARP